MTIESVRESLIHSQHRPVELVLTNGVRIPVVHAGALMFSPDTPELIVYGRHGSYKVVALAQIATVDVGPPRDPDRAQRILLRALCDMFGQQKGSLIFEPVWESLENVPQPSTPQPLNLPS